MISIFDLFKIGIGSSHTIGPMREAAAFGSLDAHKRKNLWGVEGDLAPLAGYPISHELNGDGSHHVTLDRVGEKA